VGAGPSLRWCPSRLLWSGDHGAVAEDDAAIAEPLSRALQREGYTVQVAVDGVTALERMQGSRVDLLVLDLGLPGMDGWRCAGGSGWSTPTCRC
jgi:ActR/RegA family two-component response regulator